MSDPDTTETPCVCEGEGRYPGHWEEGWLYDHYICAACKGAKLTPNFAKREEEHE